MSHMIRSFIAFDIGSAPVSERLVNVQKTLVDTGAHLKIVKPQNIHVTMRFLGNIAPTMIDPIHAEMEKVHFIPFEIELLGVGAFPTLRHARVVWAGIKKGANELTDISNQLDRHLHKLGFRSNSKKFSPHLTIARVKSGRNKGELIRAIEEFHDYQFGMIEASCLRLKESVLTPKGPIYSTLREVHR